MDQKGDEIRRSIEESRAATAEKLDMLEERVREKVEDVKSTVKRVKRMVDPKYVVSQHPWLVLGGSVLLGYMVGGFGEKKLASRTNKAKSSYGVSPGRGSSMPYSAADYYSHPEPPDQSENMLEQFKDQITVIIKGAAIRSAIGLLGPWLRSMLSVQNSEVSRRQS